jgi:capsular polysaccharide biosynthesis protein
MEPREHVELDLRQLLAVIRKHLAIILSLTGVAALTTALLSTFYLTPVYEASTQLLVNKSEKKEDALYSLNDINADLKLTETYSVIIKSPRIMDLVIGELGLPITADELTEQVEVSPVKNSQVISVTVTDVSQEQAAKIANTIAGVFQKEIIKIMNVDNVQILTAAKVEKEPIQVRPKPLLNTAIATVIGLMTGLAIAFLVEYLDTSIKNEQDVEQFLGLPVLGSIPKIDVSARAEAKVPRPRALPRALAEIAVGSEKRETH